MEESGFIFFKRVIIKENTSNIPNKSIITGEHGISRFHDKYRPRKVAKAPTPRPIKILEYQCEAYKDEIAAGIIKKANTVKIPPT